MSEKMPEVSPTISVATNYGEHVEMFEVDVVGIVHYLRKRGISDKDIESLTIEFTDTSRMTFGVDTLGTYNRDEDVITMLSLESLRKVTRVPYRLYTEYEEIDLNKTLVHEIEHKVAKGNVELQKILAAYLDKRKKEFATFIYSIPQRIVDERGDDIVNQFATETYKNNPEEIYVEKIAQESRETFVRLAPKYVDFLTVEAVDFKILHLEIMLDRYNKLPEEYKHRYNIESAELVLKHLKELREELRELPDPLRVRL